MNARWPHLAEYARSFGVPVPWRRILARVESMDAANDDDRFGLHDYYDYIRAGLEEGRWNDLDRRRR